MNSPATKTREFPALFMTGLLAAASLSSASCLRQFAHETEQTLPNNSWGFNQEVQYEPAGPEFKLAQEGAAFKAQVANRQ